MAYHLMPPPLQEWLPEGDLAWFSLGVVEQMDLRSASGFVEKSSFVPDKARIQLRNPLLEWVLTDIFTNSPADTAPTRKIAGEHNLRSWDDGGVLLYAYCQGIRSSRRIAWALFWRYE